MSPVGWRLFTVNVFYWLIASFRCHCPSRAAYINCTIGPFLRCLEMLWKQDTCGSEVTAYSLRPAALKPP